MQRYFIVTCALPFALVCTDQKYEDYVYEDLYTLQSSISSNIYLDLFANLNHNSSIDTSTSFSNGICVKPIHNYHNQEKLLAYSIQQEFIDRFLQKCTLDEFKAYVKSQKIHPTKELVSHTEWWQYRIFWEYVESLPDGHEEIIRCAQKFLKEYKSGAKRVVCWWTGMYKAGLRDLVKQKLKEHNARHQIKEEQTRQKQEQVKQQKQLHDQLYTNLVQDVQQFSSIIKLWQASDNKRWQKRAAVWQNQQSVTFATHQFILSQNQQQFCVFAWGSARHIVWHGIAKTVASRTTRLY